MSDLPSLFQKHCIVPDVLTTAPTESLEIIYHGDVKVDVGKELTPTQVQNEPIVKWVGKEGNYYTLAMVDPDAPSREKPTFREWHHWLVGNIVGSNLNTGETLSEYIGAGPPKGTGLHRYVFLIYKQPQKLNFSKIPRLPNNSGEKRGKFSISKFAQDYQLGVPLAGNFFVAKYDDYVPKLYAKLKGK